MKSSGLSWLFTLLITVALFGFLLFQVELDSLFAGLRQIPAWCIWAAIVLFCGEGLMSTLRIRVCALPSPHNKKKLLEALSVNGWYVLLVLALPARLGEVAAVAVMGRGVDMSIGSAAMSIVFQRLLDVICLSLLSLILISLAFVGQHQLVWLALMLMPRDSQSHCTSGLSIRLIARSSEKRDV